MLFLAQKRNRVVIEYLLLFSLGFLAAVLAGLLVAPAVGKRIAHFTENRIRATVPISTQELRARTDMLKAAYAAENARLGQDVRHEREKSVASELKAERLLGELKQEREEAETLSARIRELESENSALGQQIAHSQAELKAAQGALEEKQAVLDTREEQLAEMAARAEHLDGLLNTGKIDIVARETELDNLRSSLNILRNERDRLRDDIRLAEDRARYAEIRLEQDHGKIMNLHERLERELALNADHEDAIERRSNELEKLKESLKSFGLPEEEEPASVSNSISAAKPAVQSEGQREVVIDQERMAESVRRDAASISDALVNGDGSVSDDVMREEIASIAARMVALTAAREGASSPLLSLIDERNSDGSHERVSLAERSARLLSGEDA
jgi:DNA repair exonuclease SbcCD ATPase subunit